MSRPSYPQTLDPYVRIGSTVLSKSFNCRSSGRSRLLALMKRRCIAFFDCSTRCFLACKKLSDLENITPKYFYLSTILIVLSPNLNSKLLLFLELNIIISVLLKFILSLHIWQ